MDGNRTRLSARAGAPRAATLCTIVLAGAFLAGCGGSGAPGPDDDSAATGDVRVDPAVLHQTIVGWETFSDETQFQFLSLFEQYRMPVLRQAVNDLGINALRLEIRSGSEHPVDFAARFLDGEITFQEWKREWYQPRNDNDDPFVARADGFQFTALDFSVEKVLLPMRELLRARGEELHVTLNYVDFKASSFAHYRDPEEYAEFIAATMKHLREKYGVVPDAVEAVLEPDGSAGWSPERLSPAIAAAAERLEAEGFEIEGFVAPSTSNMSRAVEYFDRMRDDPGFLENLWMYSYHRYGGVSADALSGIVSRAATHGVHTGMLEFGPATHETLHTDLAEGNVSLWHQFGLVFPTNDEARGVLYRIDPETAEAFLTPTAKFFRQYYRYVRGGARRIGASSDREELDPLAFTNPGGGVVVVVKTSAAADFSVSGLPAGTYGVTYTTDDEADVSAGDRSVGEDGLLETGIPARGVLTVFRR